MCLHIGKIFILLLIFSFFNIRASEYNEVKNLLNLGLPVLEIITENQEEPTCEYVDAPKGSMGRSITNATKVPGSVTLYDTEGSVLYQSGDYKKGESGMTIKIRGNTSAYADKKPFKIKLQKKGDMLARGEDRFKDKNWVLLNDRQMFAFLGFQLSKLLDMDWTPECLYVNVIFNGDFRGIYLLTEAVERNEKCRINVSETGFIAEHDPYWWNENGEYLVSESSPSYNYTLKYPEYSEIDLTRLEEIQTFLIDYEESLHGWNYDNNINLNSFAKWILGHDILGTSDGGGVNFYLVKYDDRPETLIKAGPLWDFDTSERNVHNWSGVRTTVRFKYLFENTNPSFRKHYLEVWKRFGNRAFDAMLELSASLRDNKDLWKSFDLSQKEDAERWNYQNYSSSYVGNRAFHWYQSRKKWMNDVLKESLIPESSIDNLDAEDTLFKTVYDGVIPYFDGIVYQIYSLDGKIICEGVSKANVKIPINNSGIYVLKTEGHVQKILIK